MKLKLDERLSEDWRKERFVANSGLLRREEFASTKRIESHDQDSMETLARGRGPSGRAENGRVTTLAQAAGIIQQSEAGITPLDLLCSRRWEWVLISAVPPQSSPAAYWQAPAIRRIS
jgi:hypothetical protein